MEGLLDPSSKNRPSEMDQLLVRGQKTVQVGKYENQKKKHPVDRPTMHVAQGMDF